MRSFYEDDDNVVNTPGLDTKIPSKLQKEESLHGADIIRGMAVRTTPVLEKYANDIRHWVFDKYQVYGAELETQRSLLNNEWTSLKSEVNSLIADPVLPQGIYILTASLTGSILVNRKLLPVRFLTPLVVGLAATAYWMPNTFNNITAKLGHFEQQYAPQAYQEQQKFFKENLANLDDEFKRGLRYANGSLQMTIHDARLKVANAFGEEKKD